MKNLKRVLSLALCLCMALGATPGANAAGSNPVIDGTGQVAVELTADAASLSVTLPTGLPVTVKANGDIVVATDAKIANDSPAPVKVTGVSVTATSPWNLVDWATDFTGKKIDDNDFALNIQGVGVAADGSCAATFNSVPAGGNIGLTYDAKAAPRSEAKSGAEMAKVVFTVGWDEEESGGETVLEDVSLNWEYHVDGAEVVLDDYIGTSSSVTVRSAYTVDGNVMDKVRIGVSDTGPETGPFEHSDNTRFSFESGVKAPVDASGMFAYTSSLALDGLENIDWSETTNMENMFCCTSLDANTDLSGIDVSNVMNVVGMFDGADISQFTADSISGWRFSDSVSPNFRWMLSFDLDENMGVDSPVLSTKRIVDVSGWNVPVSADFEYFADEAVVICENEEQAATFMSGNSVDGLSNVYYVTKVAEPLYFDEFNGTKPDFEAAMQLDSYYLVEVPDTIWNPGYKIKCIERRDEFNRQEWYTYETPGGTYSVMMNSDGDGTDNLKIVDLRSHGLPYWVVMFTDQPGSSRLTFTACPEDCKFISDDIYNHSVDHSPQYAVWDIKVS